jgi:hypothetical protein
VASAAFRGRVLVELTAIDRTVRKKVRGGRELRKKVNINPPTTNFTTYQAVAFLFTYTAKMVKRKLGALEKVEADL